MEQAYQERLEMCESVIEEVTAENTRLVMQLDSVESLEKDKSVLQEHVDQLEKMNKGLKGDIEQLKHKLKV